MLSRSIYFWNIGVLLCQLCCSQQKAGTNLDANPHAAMLQDDVGLIETVICQSGSGIADFFTNASNGFNACVIYPFISRGSFVSGSKIVGLHSDSDTLFLGNRSWGLSESFKSSDLDGLMYRYRITPNMLTDWLESNQAFSKLYSRVELEPGSVLDLNELDDQGRLEFMLSLGALSDLTPTIENEEIVWKFTNERFSSITIRKASLLDGQLHPMDELSNRLTVSEKLQLLNAEQIYFQTLGENLEKELISKSAYGADVSFSPLVFRANQICYCEFRSTGRHRCIPNCNFNLMTSSFGSYFQDRLHARSKGEGTLKLNTSRADLLNIGENWLYCYNADRWAEWLNTVQCSGMKCESDPLCGIAGGNMFVCEKVLFMGTDELHRILHNVQLRRNIGLGPNEKDTSLIVQALLRTVYGNSAQEKTLIWVGTDQPTRVHSAQSENAGKYAYQPIYHIDLFFNPLGIIGEGNNFYYILGDPIGFGPVPDEASKLSELRSAINEMNRVIRDSLTSLQLNPVALKIPLGVKYNEQNGYTVGVFFAFCNGLFENSQSTTRYLFPRYSSNVTGAYYSQYNSMESVAVAKLDTLNRLGGVNHTTTFIESRTYNGDSALRCQVKVVKRR